MLSSTSPAQRNFSEEDGSGSDAGSEVGLEPETDRFGFILTNGSTAGSVGPPPELVRQRETKWINIISQWDRMLLKKTSKVKEQCQKGIPASLRAKCWPLLCGATDKMNHNKNLYQSLDSQSALQSWVDVIERDLDRQFPFHEMFLSKDGHGQRGLFRVLKAYTQYQPEEGYCQAQGPVAAVLLMNMPAEEAFWCLVQISEQYLPGYYSPLLEGVLFDAAMLNWVLKRTCPAAHKHLQNHGVEPLMFATDWLMCLFTRHLPFNTLLRVWDLFFCYGVRVLLQVAAVLVRRVLGRAEQRKLCQGQMETLEKLRGVKEQVQEEDDAFIAEVCSLQLSARDLEKQTEKELEKWRKDRPSSTFDPRGRCQGYRMAWARIKRNEEERDRKEREKGNLSVPLARSASTLSLSPSLIHKRWRKGGKASTREWEGGRKIVRHLSMGAKDDWSSWTELNFKKVQGVQEEEDVVLEQRKKQRELKQTEQQEHLEEPKKKDIQPVEKQSEQAETIITEKEKSHLKETEESKVLSEQTEETNMETEQTEGLTAENILRPAEVKQGEELDSYSQSQVLEQQSHESEHLEIEVKEANKETEKQVSESEHTAAAEGNQNEIQKDTVVDENTEGEMQESVDLSSNTEEEVIQDDVKAKESTETEYAQQTQVDATETSSETDSQVEAPIAKDQTAETQTQQQEVITETDTQGDAFEGKHHSTESLARADIKEESHTQTETETDELTQTQERVEGDAATQELEAEIVKTDSETDAVKLILCFPECLQPKEGIDLTADTDTEAEIPVANNILTESSEASEKEFDAVPEPTQEEEERYLTAHSEAQVDSDPTQADETPTETETTDTTAPLQEQATSTTQPEVADVNVEPDGKMSSAETSTSEKAAPGRPMTQVTMGAVEEEEAVRENTVEEDNVFVSTKPTDSPNTDGNPQDQEKDSHLVREQVERDNSGLTQVSGLLGSRTSGDCCVRKSCNSRESRLARRLSEDLFTMPEKNSQSQSTSKLPDVKHSESRSSLGALNLTQAPPDVTERTAVQQEQPPPDPPKRFSLFHRLRREQSKKAKGKPKMEVPKILIQDFSDGTGKPVELEVEEKLSSRERRRQRRERERREKEEERSRKKIEKELGKEKERERRKPQTRGKSFQAQGEKRSSEVSQPAKTGSQTLRHSASFAQSYF